MNYTNHKTFYLSDAVENKYKKLCIRAKAYPNSQIGSYFRFYAGLCRAKELDPAVPGDNGDQRAMNIDTDAGDKGIYYIVNGSNSVDGIVKSDITTTLGSFYIGFTNCDTDVEIYEIWLEGEE